MSVPSMVHRSGDNLVVRSVVSGDALYGSQLEADKGASKQRIIDAKDLPECKVKRNYSCGTCDFFTQNPRNYLYHLRDVHKEKVKIYECPNCLYASKHFQKLLRHTKMVHGTAETSTTSDQPRPKTRKRSLDEDSAEECSNELKDIDDDKPVHKCSMCAYIAKSSAQLSKHERDEHIKTKFFRCTKCTYVTHMKARFTKHVKYHSMPMIKCDMCDFRTPYKWNLDRHCKNHNGRGAFRCSACNFTADIKQSLTVHEMNHHVPPVGQAAGLGVGRRRNKVGASDSTAAEDGIQVAPVDQEYAELVPRRTNTSAKVASANINKNSQAETDFVHPDDIVQHANGKVYIKTKCRFCSFKTAWDSEMVRHEKNAHSDLMLTPPKKKVARPVPDLLPINHSPKEKRSDTVMSQTDIKKILAGSKNSALKDFAKLFGSEDVFQQDSPQAPKSFFDKFKDNLCESENLTCEHCGRESKCLTEHTSHKKTCGKLSVPKVNITPMHKLGSTRCQYCRQRCKSSKDLFNHLLTCEEAQKGAKIKEEACDNNQTEYHADNDNDKKPHPMENKVFIWTKMEEEESDSNHLYDCVDNKSQDQDQISLDLSIRTQSPNSESSSSLTNNNNNNNNNNYEMAQIYPTPSSASLTQLTIQTPPMAATPTTDKIPTHGNDISVAQHKRVFKCPHCTFWASTASRFHVHIVGHLNKKPFECSLCAYRSNWRWDITKHIKLKSVRDPAHESAKVLMTDETGRRNYTKYNKYLTEIHVNGGPDAQETSGGMGTRPKDKQKNVERPGPLRPPPQLKPADEYINKVPVSDKKKSSGDGKKTYWQCKKCNFRDLCKDKTLVHVRGHYPQSASATTSSCASGGGISGSSPGASGGRFNGPSTSGLITSGGDLDSERHCRLKHGGDIKVIMGGRDKDSEFIIDESMEHMDVSQDGSLKCSHCPFSSNDLEEYHMHLEGHIPTSMATIKCCFCNYYVAQKEDLFNHLKLHGVNNSNFIIPKDEKPQTIHEPEQSSKRYKCATCPYVTNSKSQFTYHKQFHKPRNGQYSCSECSYNVSKRHLLHQHMKVHGITVSPQKQNGEVLDLEEITDEIEEVHSPTFDWQNLPEIPLVWVSKSGKFSKMYRCRYCPHVNLRKVNIMEHEKMHGNRERNSSRYGENEHRCPECNYVCNNAGVLSSHNKVHQGLYGAVHGLVDSSKTDEEQIRELGANTSNMAISLDEEIDYEMPEPEILHFCNKCPARFLKENEFTLHATYHGANFQLRCEFCTYSSQQKAYLQAHNKVHTKDYQVRTKALIDSHRINPETPPPEVSLSGDAWIVEDGVSSEDEQDNGYIYKKMNVPLSGTDLFLQKSEAEAHESGHASAMKSSKIREKRYKCPKCPCQFEKREQFKHHLGLHGSKQQFTCSSCDYSVVNYTNLQQHEKKHQLAKSHEDDIEEVDASIPPLVKEQLIPDVKKPFWCTMCPYTNTRRDAVDNHQKRHVKLSGIESNYMCKHCDYSVPQLHFLRDHTKLHFSQNKMHSPDAFMAQHMIQYSIKADDQISETTKYSIKEDVESSLLNNNEGEKVFINTQTGEVVESKKDSEMDTS